MKGLNLETIPRYVIEEIASNMGWEEGQAIYPYEQRIACFEPVTAFEKYCNWNGLVDWGGLLWGIAKILRDAEQEREP